MDHHTTYVDLHHANGSGQWDAFAEGTPVWDVDPVAGGLAVGLNGDMYYVPPGDALVSASGVMAEAPKTLGYILGEEIWSFLMGWDEQDPVADIISIPSSPALDLRLCRPCDEHKICLNHSPHRASSIMTRPQKKK
ncbi:hypothetical protein ZWY2020_057574 [Hordeum vulgare]|nr:hypothetical protein ZWY2020_057574 [Hordeum vulgare]